MPVLKTVFSFSFIPLSRVSHSHWHIYIHILSAFHQFAHFSTKKKQKFPEGGSMSDIVASALYPLYIL